MYVAIYFSFSKISFFRAPTDCAQYVTGASGFLQSYSFQSGEQITAQAFTFCIRREAGYCAIAYKKAAGSTIDAFILDSDVTQVATVRFLP